MRITFRADGNSATGLGHIMRSAALLQILQHHFVCEFWTQNVNYFPKRDFQNLPVIKEFIHDELLEEAKVLSKEIEKNSVVVLDGYKFKTEYQKILKEAGLKVVCIDDTISNHFLADVIINHAGGIDRAKYSKENYTKLYLGPKYALVKLLFYTEKKLQRDLSDYKVLVSLGGSDPQNDTSKVVNILANLNIFQEIHIVIGAANSHYENLKLNYSINANCYFHSNLSGEEMYRVMKLCPYSILTPSTICYEYMTLGGIVFLYQIADNQSQIKKYFIKNNMAYSFEQISNVSMKEKKYILKKQKAIFDEQSPQRLLNIFLKFKKIA